MSFPLTLSTPSPSTSFTIPKKRLRGFSGEDANDLDVSTQDRRRRKQLKIEIPPTLHSPDSWTFASLSTVSVKGSPTSLFSDTSEVNSLFEDVPPIPDLHSATSHLHPCNSTWSTPAASINGSPTFSTMSEADSLFDDVPSVHHARSATSPRPRPRPRPQSRPPIISDQSVLHPALLTGPPIQGLYFDPSLCLPQHVAESVIDFCLYTYFRRPGVNQVMLFGRAPRSLEDSPNIHSPNGDDTMPDMDMDNGTHHIGNIRGSNPTQGLPTVLIDLLSTLSTLLKPFLPEPAYSLLFPPTPTQARQAIINLYDPGEGISPHVDLLKRYGDGIIGVSFGSGCVMRFDRVDHALAGSTDYLHHHQQERQRERWDLYLPERTVLVLTEAARYEWTHGIDERTRDYVSASRPEYYEQGVDGMSLDDDQSTFSTSGTSGRWIERNVRLSVTFRWLLPGADVVGPVSSN